MAHFLITSTTSFNDAIASANANDEADTISFAPALTELALDTELTISDRHGLTIDGDHDDDGVSDIVLRSIIGPDTGFYATNALFTVAEGAVATVRNVDILGHDLWHTRDGTDGTSGDPGDPATIAVTGDRNGGIGGDDATPGKDGTPGSDGEDAAGAILNLGQLTLERVGFGGHRAVAGDGSFGGWGGDGGNSEGGAGDTDVDPFDTPEPRPAFETVARPGQPSLTIYDWSTIYNRENVPQPGGTGGAAGPGADGGHGAPSGGGGDAASAILNEGSLVLTDVAFGGRLTSGRYAAENVATGGDGRLGGRGGDGGSSLGGLGGDSGVEWTRNYSIRFPSSPEDPEQELGTYVLEFGTGLPGAGGAAGAGGDGGNGARGGDGGDAATLINRGTVTGTAAGGGGATAGTAGAGGPGGEGGISRGGFGGAELAEFHRHPQGGAYWAGYTDGSPVPASVQRAAELNRTGRAPAEGALPTGERGPDGASSDGGRAGAAGEDGTAGMGSAGLLDQTSGTTQEFAASLVYLHALAPAEGDGTLGFNIIRIGDTSGAAEVSWRLVGAGDDPVTGAVFAGGVLPSGRISFAATPEAAGAGATESNVHLVQVELASGALAGPPAGWRFELSDASGVDLGTAAAAGMLGDEGAGPITGTPGPDTLDGTAGADEILGLDGDDLLRGMGGDDTLEGGDGADTINGGDGDDLIRGGETEADLRDVIYAGAGDDSVDGGYGNDLIYGMGGNDTLAGGFGADTIQGQDGDDVITGSAFGDIVFGNAGNDFVNGGFGHDLINGGTGADKFFHVGGTRDQMLGHGSDWVQDYSAAEGDVLVFGGAASAADFQVNFTHTENRETGERSGDDDVQEAFVIYKPTGQILWALVDGAGQDSINLQIGGDVFDLLG